MLLGRIRLHAHSTYESVHHLVITSSSVSVFTKTFLYFCFLSTTGEILQASDDLSRVINSYKEIVEGQTVNGDTPGSSMSERKFHFQA